MLGGEEARGGSDSGWLMITLGDRDLGVRADDESLRGKERAVYMYIRCTVFFVY